MGHMLDEVYHAIGKEYLYKRDSQKYLVKL